MADRTIPKRDQAPSEMAWARFDAAAARLAQEGKFDLDLDAASDLDLLEKATAMTKCAWDIAPPTN